VDLPATADFNFFDGALCDAGAAAFPSCLSALLPDFFAAALRVFAAGVLADVFDRGRDAFPDEVLGEFLRVFLDIRLPFVAFGGSTMGVLRPCLGEPESGRLLGKSDRLGVRLQGFDAPPVRSLNVLLGPDDE
jgi:hypothetical protein